MAKIDKVHAVLFLKSSLARMTAHKLDVVASQEQLGQTTLQSQ